jgi:flagellar motor protein MotB
MTQNFGAQQASYRQGLVLGLTMAEVMLLIVFTLLLVAGALLQKSHARIQNLQQAVAEKEREARAATEADLRETQYLQEQLKRMSASRIPDNWRELVRINEDIKQFERDSGDENLHDVLSAALMTKKALQSLGYKLSDPRDIPDIVLKATPPAGQFAAAAGPGHNWPPIIRLSEADHYYFELGKAEISPAFREQLVAAIIPRVIELIRTYDVDGVEVIGHTDEVPISGRTSNLDLKLLDALRGRSSAEDLTFADNAGLAMARASAVARVLMEDQRLNGFRILPLSGAQVINTDERLAEGSERHETASRRRIEIRLRRTSQVQ